MTLHKITEFYTKLFSVYHNKTSKFHTIIIFKKCVKQNNDSNKTYRYVHDLLLLQSSFVWVQWFMSCFHKNKLWILTFKRPPCSYFLFFDKNDLIKSCSSFEELSVYKISWSHVDWCKFCIHLRSLNVRHFGIVEGMGLMSKASRSPSMAWPPYWIS
jgi:hypothetical protein